MTNNLKKLISVMLCLAMLVAVAVTAVPEIAVPVSAATYRTGANAAHSSYTGSKFYRNFQKIELTGDGRTDVLAIALSQLGYQESPTAYDFDGIGGGSGNYTEYCYNMGDFGVGYGGSSYAWCATFVSWALYQSHCTDQGTMGAWTRNHSGDANYIWREVSCHFWATQLKNCGYFQRSKAYNGNTYIPQPGDLIFFCWDGPSGSEDHIGIVVYSDGTNVYTIEGNTSNQNGLNSDGGGVYFKSYSLGYNYITGYGVLPYKTNSNVPKIDYSGANPTPGYYVCNASKYIYATETATSPSYYSERFSMFEVVGVASNGRLKAKGITTTTGAVVEGYILNNEDRVIQLSASALTPAAELDATILEAKSARYDHYTEAALANLYTAYNEAVTLRSNNASDSQLTAANTKLKSAINNNIFNNEKIISVGKGYTYPTNTRTDKWADTGSKLTDGVKATADGGADSFAGWNNAENSFVIDLGGSVASDTYRIYTSANSSWGIDAPTNVAVYVSNDNSSFTKIASTTVIAKHASEGDWSQYTMTLRAKQTRNERYIKFVVTNGNHLWLEEIEVGVSGIPATDRVYVTGMNKYVTAGSVVIFTPAAGEITTEKYNHSWTKNVIAAWDSSAGCYVVKSVTQGSGADSTPSVTLASNEILIAAHQWEGAGIEEPVIGSFANLQRLGSAAVGTKLSFTNIDINNVSLGAAPAISLSGGGHSHTPGAWTTLADGSKEQRCTECGEVIATQPAPIVVPDNAKTFWVTHISDNTIEVAGVIFTQAYEGAAWWLHVAFSPVSGKSGVFEIVEISDGTDGGDATALSIPSGGFVWAINYGNNYPELYPDDATAIDYTSPNCNNATNDALTWAVGDKFVFYGINPLTPTVSTSTPDTKWYDDAYVCTSYYAPYSEAHVHTPGTAATCTSAQTCTTCGAVLEAAKGHTAGAWVTLSDGSKEQRCSVCNFLLATQPAPDNPDVPGDVMLGDVNNDGAIDQYDYILVKRHYFETRYLTDDEMTRADVNLDGNINQYDYILIKRHYFGTYVIG